jgi:hypothetical protein
MARPGGETSHHASQTELTHLYAGSSEITVLHGNAPFHAPDEYMYPFVHYNKKGHS